MRCVLLSLIRLPDAVPLVALYGLRFFPGPLLARLEVRMSWLAVWPTHYSVLPQFARATKMRPDLVLEDAPASREAAQR